MSKKCEDVCEVVKERIYSMMTNPTVITCENCFSLLRKANIKLRLIEGNKIKLTVWDL